MRHPLGRASRTLALVGLLALGAGSARAAFLTGAAVYSTDSTGAPSSGEFWNTLGGDNRYNLYVAIGPNDPILNPGDGASTSVNLALPVGTYTYDIYGENAVAYNNYALALYLNGNNSAPAILAFTATDGSTQAEVVPASAGSVGLDSTASTSPGSMSFDGTTTTVTLDSFTWAAPTTGGLDRVSGYASTPSGEPDFVGSFTLSVSPNAGSGPAPVPEPASVALLGLGSLGLGLMARRRMARASA